MPRSLGLLNLPIIDGYVTGVDDPVAWKMEALLHSFRKQMHFEVERNTRRNMVALFFFFFFFWKNALFVIKYTT